MRYLVAALCALLLWMNWLLWRTPDTGIQQIRSLERQIALQRQENSELEERNHALEAEVRSLREDLAAIEERARAELGMTRRDETFFHILEQVPRRAAETDGGAVQQ